MKPAVISGDWDILFLGDMELIKSEKPGAEYLPGFGWLRKAAAAWRIKKKEHSWENQQTGDKIFQQNPMVV